MKIFPLKNTPLKLAVAGLLGAAAIASAPNRALAMNPIILTGQIPSSLDGIYTINYVTGKWSDVSTQLQAQAWWNDTSLASTLSVALAGSPTPPGGGVLTNAFVNNGVGPAITSNLLFATSALQIFPPFGPSIVQGQTSQSPFMAGTSFQVLQSDTFNWATATKAPLPGTIVPGPLPLVGAATAFGFSRRLRSRINKSASA